MLLTDGHAAADWPENALITAPLVEYLPHNVEGGGLKCLSVPAGCIMDSVAFREGRKKKTNHNRKNVKLSTGRMDVLYVCIRPSLKCNNKLRDETILISH